jgi:hypothetical protein
MFDGDLRDNYAWDAYLRAHTSGKQRRELARRWRRSEAFRRAWIAWDGQPRAAREKWPFEAHSTTAYRAWIERILALDVTLKPNARAVLRDPDVSFRVELEWVDVSATRGRARHEPRSLSIIGEPTLRKSDSPEFDLGDYYTAFFVHVADMDPVEAFKGAPSLRPAAGQAPSIDFYKWLLSAEESLRAEGDPHPAKSLAERLGEERTTVRTWLKRGRQYLQREES